MIDSSGIMGTCENWLRCFSCIVFVKLCISVLFVLLLCISYFTVEEIPIIDRQVGEEVNRGQLCSFVSAWVMSGKVSQRRPREIGSSDVTSRAADTRWKGQLRSGSPTAAGTGGVCPQAPGCVSSCPPNSHPHRCCWRSDNCQGIL